MLVLLTLLFPTLATATTVDPFLRCELLLDSDWARANRAEVIRLYAEDEPVDEIAYVGVSSRELIELLNKGAIDAKGTRMWPRLVANGRDLTEFLSRHTSFEHDADAKAVQVKRAREDAWVRTVADVVAVRHAAEAFTGDKVQVMLRRLDQGFRAGKTYSPSFAKLREVIEASDLSPVGKSTMRRVRGVCDVLNLPWPRKLEAGQAALERAMTTAFANLPAAGGTVLSFNAAVLKRITWSQHAPPHLPRLELADLNGIEPGCDEAYTFLEQLARGL